MKRLNKKISYIEIFRVNKCDCSCYSDEIDVINNSISDAAKIS
ncbi:hypothetical protein PV797_06985 [Clostridiaceae bacterium M8S5]|nr:hypothetical protein PV797_06985 [Clostridiaceae bacterium M8S5]